MSSERRVARRYAKGLYSMDQGNPDKAKKHLEMLSGLRALFNDKEGGKVLRSPVMPPALKRELLAYGLKQVGADGEVSNVVNAIVDAGRVAVIPDLVDEYAALIDAAAGLVKADVVSAVALEPGDLKAIGDHVARLLNKKVEVRPSVDRALLGGFLVRVGNYRIDMSLRTKLDALSHTAAQDSLR